MSSSHQTDNRVASAAKDSGRHPGSLFDPLTRPLSQWVSNFVTHHTTTEWLVGLAIILTWAVVAFAPIGAIAAGAAVLVAIVLHYVAMESGGHVWLWIATTAMLLFVTIAYSTVLNQLGPVSLAVGGAMALAYNEAVRLNYSRRRGAVVDPGVFVGSVIALFVATAIGVAGVVFSVLLTARADRSWIWMPATVLILIVLVYALVLLPARRAPQTNQQRWEPGTRIPPQPIGPRDPAGDVGPLGQPPPPPPPG